MCGLLLASELHFIVGQKARCRNRRRICPRTGANPPRVVFVAAVAHLLLGTLKHLLAQEDARLPWSVERIEGDTRIIQARERGVRCCRFRGHLK